MCWLHHRASHLEAAPTAGMLVPTAKPTSTLFTPAVPDHFLLPMDRQPMTLHYDMVMFDPKGPPVSKGGSHCMPVWP